MTKKEECLKALQCLYLEVDASIADDVKRKVLDALDEANKNFVQPDVRFQLPSDKQMIDIAILFNDGKLEQQKLADMVGYGQFIIDRLYENGDVGKPSSKEEGN